MNFKDQIHTGIKIDIKNKGNLHQIQKKDDKKYITIKKDKIKKYE